MKLKGLQQIAYFSENLRREDFEPFSYSEDDLLDLLHPEKEKEIPTKLDWNSDWPNASSHGVYLIYDKDLELIYVGTATNLGRRLSTYFGGGKKCELRQEWGIDPRYVLTVGVPEKTWFEAPALESYLIYELQPALNTKGK